MSLRGRLFAAKRPDGMTSPDSTPLATREQSFYQLFSFPPLVEPLLRRSCIRVEQEHTVANSKVLEERVQRSLGKEVAENMARLLSPLLQLAHHDPSTYVSPMSAIELMPTVSFPLGASE